MTGKSEGEKPHFTEEKRGFCLQKKFLIFSRKKKLPSEFLIIACTAIHRQLATINR
jgi:hypothetical protein